MRPIEPILRNEHTAKTKETGIGQVYQAKKGDIVKGTIIGRSVPDKVVLVIGGKPLTAKTSIDLAVGRDAYFRVDQVKPELVLKLVEATHIPVTDFERIVMEVGNNGHLYRRLFKGIMEAIKGDGGQSNVDRPDGTARLSAVFEQVALKKENVGNRDFLKYFLERSGLSFENKLKRIVLDGDGQKKCGEDGTRRLKRNGVGDSAGKQRENRGSKRGDRKLY